MKEKIGRLLELLNEYEIEREEKIDLFNDKEKPLWEWYKDCTGDLTFEPTDSKILNGEAFSGDTGHSVIISKSYGFIKWLVENDKIDRDKELKENGLFRKYFYDLEYVKNYDRLVMWLSVEDEPINFLISILK